MTIENIFYSDIQWATQNGLMNGVSGSEFAPASPVSQAMVAVVLARLGQVDLTKLDKSVSGGIPTGRWFSDAVIWAAQSGLLSNGGFQSGAPLKRADMAVMLVKYLALLGLDVSQPEDPIVFADADKMTAEQNAAFQVLYARGVFRGVGHFRMDPEGSTTRGQFTALLHRMSDSINQEENKEGE